MRLLCLVPVGAGTATVGKELTTKATVLLPSLDRCVAIWLWRRLQGLDSDSDGLESLTHLVEIDLLRDGEPLPLVPPIPASHYRILISRSHIRPVAALYVFNLGDHIPDIPVPLRAEDSEPVVRLQAIVNELYEQLGYVYFSAYDSAPPAPWSMEEVAMFKRMFEKSKKV